MAEPTTPGNETEIGPPEATPPPLIPAPRPWGFWATLGFGVLTVAGAMTAALAVFAVGTLLVSLYRGRAFRLYSDPEAAWIELIAIAAMCGAGIALVFLFARLRKTIPVAEYLGLTTVRRMNLTTWCVLAALVSVVYLTLCAVLGLSINFEVDDALEQFPTRLSWFAEVLVVPVFTVLLFQGFLLPGFCYSPLGRFGGSAFTMIFWMALWYVDGIDVAVFMAVFGVLLTWARLQTGSTLVPCAMYITERCLAITAVMTFDLPVK